MPPVCYRNRIPSSRWSRDPVIVVGEYREGSFGKSIVSCLVCLIANDFPKNCFMHEFHCDFCGALKRKKKQVLFAEFSRVLRPIKKQPFLGSGLIISHVSVNARQLPNRAGVFV